MAIFLNIFIKTIAIFFSILFVFVFIILTISFIKPSKNNDFSFISGEENSSNIIAIIQLNGLIINNSNQLSELVNPFIISPNRVKTDLDNLNKINPKVIVFSINSPGGTVSASKNLYDIITEYKNNNKETQIIFHTNELLASGGYWASMSADKIFSNYGAIIGSIGVKGPDWFYYDQPISISSGIFGNRIETKKGIEVFTNIAGKSKDIFNPFRKPTEDEINQLLNMVNEIYDDFINTVSKKRKIETQNIEKEIGATIYTSGKAKQLYLIDGEMTLDNLIKKIINEKKYIDYKLLKKFNKKNSLLNDILTGGFYKNEINLQIECLTLRSSISVILSYESTGC